MASTAQVDFASDEHKACYLILMNQYANAYAITSSNPEHMLTFRSGRRVLFSLYRPQAPSAISP